MSDIYSEQHRALQRKFDTVRLADRVDEVVVRPELADDQKAFIESRDMFFLTSIDHRGYPTCSYKGGAPGFVKVLDKATIAFPNYNGNGMFLSMGNIGGNHKVGLLFLDFETPHRVRVHGLATIDQNDPLMPEFVGAELVVRVAVTETFINCPRYVHRYSSACKLPNMRRRPVVWRRHRRNGNESTRCRTPLPEREKDLAEKLGGTITFQEYGARVIKGDG